MVAHPAVNSGRMLPRILHEVRQARLISSSAPAAFAVLAGVLAAVGVLPMREALPVAVSVLLAFVPTAMAAPGGWPRRAAELALLPAGYALAMLSDPTMRAMVVPPLLVLAAWAAFEAAAARSAARWQAPLVAFLALSVRAATGLGLLGAPLWAAALAVAAAATLPWGVARRVDVRAGALVALALAALPLQNHAVIAAVLAAGGAAVALQGRAPRAFRLVALTPGAVAAAMAAAAVAAWGGLAPTRAFPHAGWAAVLLLLAVLAASRWLPAGAAGAAWLALAFAFGPLQPAPPDRAGFSLSPERPDATLAAGTGGTYVIDMALANAGDLPLGTPVATLDTGTETLALLAGVDTAEWAHERPDVRDGVAHPLPDTPVWRPGTPGAKAFWGVAGRVETVVPAGYEPRLRRDPELPARVSVSVGTAGPSRPTPPRTWALPAWLLFAAVVVLLLQAASGGLSDGLAVAPWALLSGAALAAAMPVEPLRLVLERHAVDVALAAVLAAWLPAARTWLRHRRVVLAGAALLLPLAVATPRLTPSLYGDEPFHLIVMSSMEHDLDVDIRNNYDLEHHPYNRIYMTGKILLHSPVLGLLLLPGYVLGGRTGALLLLALVGAVTVALLVRRGRGLGVPESRLALLAVVLAVSYPLATFATQIWVELPGALMLAALLLLASRTPPARWLATGTALLAAAMKTRLALATFPVAAAAWWRRRTTRRDLVLAGAALAVAAAASLAVGWLFLGHPFGFYRRLGDLIPKRRWLPLKVVAGLAFDPAGGLAWIAPLALVALAGFRSLWRRGGDGERAALLGFAATVLALLHSHEWYGGGSPPARYLVPFLPVFALAGALLLREPRRWRHLAFVLVPPGLLGWWVLVSRPHFSVNPGDGGWWLADAVSRRFGADTRHLLPTFLVPDTATVAVPLALVAAAALAVTVARWRPGFARTAAALTASIWLLAGAGAVSALALRTDRVVEVEDAQVQRSGGRPEPPPGTFSRFIHPNGWRLTDGAAVAVPLNLPAGAAVEVEGWLEGSTFEGTAFVVRWDDHGWTRLAIPAFGPGRMAMPPPPGPGRHRLTVRFTAPAGQEVVLDRIVVTPP